MWGIEAARALGRGVDTAGRVKAERGKGGT